jgi:hypothetical protein
MATLATDDPHASTPRFTPHVYAHRDGLQVMQGHARAPPTLVIELHPGRYRAALTLPTHYMSASAIYRAVSIAVFTAELQLTSKIIRGSEHRFIAFSDLLFSPV